MSTEIIIGILSLLGTLGGSYFACNKNMAVMDEKIKDIKEDIAYLSGKIDKYDKFFERMAIVEERVKTLEERIKALEDIKR